MSERQPRDDEPPRWEPILGRFSLRSILWATTFAAAGSAAFSAGYYITAVVTIALAVAAFIAFAPQAGERLGSVWWWRWLLHLMGAAVWGAVLGLILGATISLLRPQWIDSWYVLYILALCGSLFGLVFARLINGVCATLLRLLRVFLP